jgi:DNA-binding response OmpR family regulator
VDQLSILVVEDDPVYAEFVASTLRAAGHDISIAYDGAHARTQAQRERPHAVILDLGLPDESGYEVARSLRAGVLDDAAVIILLTANPSPQLDTAEAVGSRARCDWCATAAHSMRCGVARPSVTIAVDSCTFIER